MAPRTFAAVDVGASGGRVMAGVVPATTERFAYIASGTWSLVGLELAGPVVTGPVEATALGNVLVQARAAGAASASLEAMRSGIAACTRLRRYSPS